ncbi:hypothetical protein HTSR_1140 [Halodesulfurarchaeum formicicum]|uniref:Uncharacterized protein n=1 Tax=Halodesulfurarchaeum formicicum TaxID=1873524 RepID=A0A1D8S4P9_9EURY|nr:DUF1684 domain-containing protein [Halodesulfurarchaeum formicicum]AOW80320.1 hypothetical protein HTSR_1140 [Halodesulfurarchaeum formicicum]APE95623.1 hypothetical protein HSR6_1175 [Halodesulfurarchaeum formicicum]
MDDDSSAPDWIQAVREHRAAKSRAFESADSPLSESAQQSFDGLDFFPIDENYRVTGRFEPLSDPESVSLDATRGPPVSFEHVGQLGVEIAGELQVLAVYRAPGVDALLVPFRDDTNGTETWAKGRYLNLTAPAASGRVSVPVDFNLAYLPLCVYDETVSSAIPPMENEISTAVRAGEKGRPTGE